MTTPTRQQKRTAARASSKSSRKDAKAQSKATAEFARLTSLVSFKPFQEPIFWDDDTGVLCLHWSRQIGKSYVLAAWAVKRLLTKPGRLVTVLSNSKDNGVEFIGKVKEVCELARIAFEADAIPADLSGIEFETMQFEVRIKVGGRVAGVKVLAANPRTARGFSGDLILDEFAFHQDSVKIWDAAEPIISSNPDYLCRIASTGNGLFNMFYRMVAGAKADATAENPGGLCKSFTDFIVSRVARSKAFILGQKIYDPKTRQPITPDQARAASLDKQSYDQNYELSFLADGVSLLTDDLVSQCEYQGADNEREVVICEDRWSWQAIEFLRSLPGPLCFGQDVGRKRDLSVIAVGEKVGGIVFVRAILRMNAKTFPHQKAQIKRVAELPNFGRGMIDETGLGVGLVDFAQESWGVHRIVGVNFASREERDMTQAIHAENSRDRNAKPDTALVTELMGLDMLSAFGSRSVRIPAEQPLRDSLLKPQRLTVANQVRIAAETDEAGHADEFWAIALLLRCFRTGQDFIATTEGIRLGGGVGRRPRFKPRRLGGVRGLRIITTKTRGHEGTTGETTSRDQRSPLLLFESSCLRGEFDWSEEWKEAA